MFEESEEVKKRGAGPLLRGQRKADPSVLHGQGELPEGGQGGTDPSIGQGEARFR